MRRSRWMLVLVAMLCFASLGIIGNSGFDAGAQSTTWVQQAPLPLAVSGPAAVTGPGGRIYVFGGSGSDQRSVPNAEVYDPSRNSWTSISQLPVPLAYFSGALSTNGKIYLVGGWATQAPPGESVDSLIAYDPSTDTYACSFSAPGCASSSLSPLPIPVSEEGVAVGYKGRIWSIGGFASVPVNAVQVYDPATNHWYMGPSYPTADAGVRAASSPTGTIYAGYGFDGQNYLSSLYYVNSARFTPTALSAARIKQLERQAQGIPVFTHTSEGDEDRSGRKYVSVADVSSLLKLSDDSSHVVAHTFQKDRIRGVDIYVMGGETGGILSTAVDVFHVATKTWSTGPPLPAPVEDAGSAVSNGTLYLFGGDNGTQPVSNVLSYAAPAPPAKPKPTPTATPTVSLAKPSAMPTATTVPTSTPTATPPPTATPTTVPKKALTCPKHASKKGKKCACKKGYVMKKGKCVKKK